MLSENKDRDQDAYAMLIASSIRDVIEHSTIDLVFPHRIFSRFRLSSLETFENMFHDLLYGYIKYRSRFKQVFPNIFTFLSDHYEYEYIFQLFSSKGFSFIETVRQ